MKIYKTYFETEVFKIESRVAPGLCCQSEMCCSLFSTIDLKWIGESFLLINEGEMVWLSASTADQDSPTHFKSMAEKGLQYTFVVNAKLE